MSEKEAQPVGRDADDTISEDVLRKRKLELEVNELESKEKGYNKFLTYIPYITTIVAVVGLTLTAAGYFNDRQKEREANEKEGQARIEEQNIRAENLKREQRIRDENQIRNNVDQLFNSKEEQPAAKVPYLLDELARLIKRAEEPEVLKQKVTETLVRFISRDAEQLTPRHIRTDRYALEYWPDYKEYLKKHPEDNAFILDNYVEAFVNVYKKDPKYFSSIIDYKDSGFYLKPEDRRAESGTFFWFEELVMGFSMHLKMEGIAQEDIDYYIEQFQNEIKNPQLTKHLIEAKMFPHSDKVFAQQSQPNRSFDQRRR